MCGNDHPGYVFTDVYGLDEDLLEMVPQPVLAVLMLFPITEQYEEYRRMETATIRKDGQTVTHKLYFTKQTIPNACGTIGLLHALANNMDSLAIKYGPLKRIYDQTANMTPEYRARELERDSELAKLHDNSSLAGQTAAPNRDEEVDLHFVCFVEKEGHIYELDGRKPFPINHGAATNLLADVAEIVRNFIDREPDSLSFSLVALVPEDVEEED
ncbi:Ubiquitin carboxyl-terminal hydrolase isozyme L3 [Nowakowskiella sp. JEL0407]|nr:Ubiquitin carboxyl-terminal hydrolase isozyme L3 [Nowakowskiella sp. JEL0407]